MRQPGHHPVCGTILAVLSGFLLSQFHSMAATDVNLVRAVKIPPATGGQALYVGNKAPLTPSPLVKLPIGSITPKGWLRHQLELEADGMTGHLEEISKWCKFEDSAWASP